MTSFTEFLRSRQEEVRAESANLEVRKTAWLAALEELYAHIKVWLSEPLSLNLLSLEEEPVEINEYKLGPYKATRLVLRTGRDKVRIEPVGTFIIGARGRVDVTTPGASFKLVLGDDNKWGFLEDDRIAFRQLDERTFTKALQNLLS